MAHGYSIHIGLNKIDPTKYTDQYDELDGCENDARSMEALAKAAGFTPLKVLLTAEATAANVTSALGEAAHKVSKDDTLMVTYSGHGSQVKDLNGDEPDKLDETWVLYDRELIDDELYNLYGRFTKGAHIVVLSDSCHSGTVTRAMLTARDEESSRGRPRCLSSEVQAAHMQKYGQQYREIVRNLPIKENDPIDASVLLISGCQDSEIAEDLGDHGLFTAVLLEVWDKGRFTGSYRKLHADVREETSGATAGKQNPNLDQTGHPDTGFPDRKAFSI